MNKVVASNCDEFKEGDMLGVGTFSFNPSAELRLGKSKKKSFPLGSSTVQVLDEESAKSFLGAAGLGLVGVALLGPLGLLAGVLSGGNKKTKYFGIEAPNDIKIVIQTSNKKDIKILQEQVFRGGV